MRVVRVDVEFLVLRHLGFWILGGLWRFKFGLPLPLS